MSKSILSLIVDYNNERGLIKRGFDLSNEISFIQEELLEATTPLKSEEARIMAKSIVEQYISDEFHPNDEQVVDALCDVIVFAVGGIAKLGYNPDTAMEEVYKEIQSRVGEVVDGKFIKDKSPEAKAKWYKADFSQAKL